MAQLEGCNRSFPVGEGIDVHVETTGFEGSFRFRRQIEQLQMGGFIRARAASLPDLLIREIGLRVAGSQLVEQRVQGS